MGTIHKSNRPVAVFLLGGVGTRLHHVTNPIYNRNAVPKPLLPIANRSMVQRGVDSIKSAGVDNFYSTTAMMPNIVHGTYPARVSVQTAKPGSLTLVADIAGRSDFVEHFYEAEPLGTAPGVIWALQARGIKGSVIIPSGDIVTALDVGRLIEAHQKAVRDHGAVATIALNPIDWNNLSGFGTVKLVGMPDRPSDEASEVSWMKRIEEMMTATMHKPSQIIQFAEKLPGTIALRAKAAADTRAQGKMKEAKEIMAKGLALSTAQNSSYYIIEATPENLASIASWFDMPKGPGFNDFGGMVLPKLAKMGKLYGFPFSEYWSDVGTKFSYWQTQWDAMNPATGLGADLFDPARGRATVNIAPSARIIGNVVIGDNVEIGPGAIIGPNVVIGHGWKIGSNTRITDTVLISRGLRGGDGFNVRDSLTIDRAIIGSGPVEANVAEDVGIHDGTNLLLEKQDFASGSDKPKEFFNP